MITQSRRAAVKMAMSIVAGLFTSRPANAAQGFRCRGQITLESGAPASGLTVKLCGPGYREEVRSTDKDGSYELSAPDKGVYLLVLYEPASNRQIVDVRQLTGGKNQDVSLTVNSAASFAGAVANLRSAEAIAAFVLEQSPNDRLGIAKQLGGPWVDSMVGQWNIGGQLPGLSREQRVFLDAQGRACQQQLRIAFG